MQLIMLKHEWPDIILLTRVLALTQVECINTDTECSLN